MSSNNNDDVNFILDKMNKHTQNLDNHRYFYKILLIISIVLLIVAIAFIGALFGVVKKEDRSDTFNVLTYISFSLVGSAILILSIIVYLRYRKENNQDISGINKAVRNLGDAAKKAREQAADANQKALAEQLKAVRIKEAARTLAAA